jgi:ketosteroid isomerase-like protein
VEKIVMTTDPKHIARSFVEALGSEPLDSAIARFGNEDTTLWIAGMGMVSPPQLAAMSAALVDAAAGPATMIVHDVIADGDKVAVEAESHMPLKNSKIYNNKYHFKIVVRDGRLSEIKEYGDTKHVADTFHS